MSLRTSHAIVTTALCLLSACAAEVEPGDDDASSEVAASDAALRRIERIDFEDYASGDLGQPWSLTTASTGSSTTASVTRAANHGQVLRIDADASTTDFLVAKLGFWSQARGLSVQVDLDPGRHAAFVWSVDGAGSSIAKRRIRLQRGPRSSELVASSSPGGKTRCGRLPSNTWSRVLLRIHARQRPHTFDVLIDGAETACTGIETGMRAPWRSVAIMDASNAGWGGEVQIDNIAVTTP